MQKSLTRLLKKPRTRRRSASPARHEALGKFSLGESFTPNAKSFGVKPTWAKVHQIPRMHLEHVFGMRCAADNDAHARLHTGTPTHAHMHTHTPQVQLSRPFPSKLPGAPTLCPPKTAPTWCKTPRPEVQHTQVWEKGDVA